MAHHTEKDGFPALPLKPGMKIRIRALSPTLDAAITGVNVSEWSLYGRDRRGGPPLADEVPRWIPENTSGT